LSVRGKSILEEYCGSEFTLDVLTTKIHAVVADENLPIERQLSPSSAADDLEGQKLIERDSERTLQRKAASHTRLNPLFLFPPNPL